MSRRVYIAYTGGTIGMQRTGRGYLPAPGFLEDLMAGMPEFHHPGVPDYTLHIYEPLLDSSNILPDDWWSIARDIAEHYDDYDGFVVLHGTDTMAYTASALAFMLQGLAKPVILTGSQIPLCELRNDGRENLLTSLLIAADYPIPEVCLYFANKLLRGCRSVKVSADSLDAFASPNLPALGTVGVDIHIEWERVLPAPLVGTQLTIQHLKQSYVGALRLFPGISARVLHNILQPPLQGLVMEAYGVGNGPDRDAALLDVLSQATQRGVVILDCTQCLQGSVDLDDYATGAALKEAGVISGYDMTSEAALTKLYYLFSTGLSPDEVKEKVRESLRGELTLPSEHPGSS
jgi:L-asparaginase